MKFSLPAILSLNRNSQSRQSKSTVRNANHFSLFTLTLILLSLFTLTLILAPSRANAQGACDAPAGSSQEAINQLNKCAIEKDIFDDKIFNLNQISGTTDSLFNLITGSSQLHPETNTVTQNWGALATVSNMTIALYKAPPASGVQYLAGEFQKFNPVQPAYAQEGIGFGALTPVQKIWTVFRNLSYVLFVIVFVIIGFMIMLRAHISPQAVATIQDSIPRLVVALILVTFSYAIAGLFIDVMFLALNIVVNFLESQGVIPNGGGNVVFEKSVFSVILSSWTEIVSNTASAIEGLLGAVINLGWLADKILGFFIGSIGGLIVGIAMLFIMFRVFLMLLMSYVMIIILTMVAPFFFLVQALPGNNGAKEWFKQMAANVAVFPAVAIMFIFAGILGGITALGGPPESAFTVGGDTGQYIGQFPLLVGGLDAVIVGKLIAIGLLLMTPQAGEMVKRFITGPGGGGGGFGAGAAIGGAIGAGAGVVGAGARGAGRAAWNYGYAGSPVGKFFGERKQMEAERQTISARKQLYTSAPKQGGGITKADIRQYGVGYPGKK